MAAEINIVTGAFSFTGKYITSRLMQPEKFVRTFTNHPGRKNPFLGQVKVSPYNFDKPEEMVKHMEGATTLYNTYWVRFPYKDMTYEKAVENSKILFQAAKDAGIKRVVHVSITNASEDSKYGYFRGKALVENALRESGLSYAILRPAVVIGKWDILMNNIAWMLRRFPVFAIPGSGEYKLQPIYVDDLAQLAVAKGRESGNCVIDAIGPETLTFNEVVDLIARIIRSKAKIVHLPAGVAYAMIKQLNFIVNDIILTREEIYGLMDNLLMTNSQPIGEMRLENVLRMEAETLGTEYHSEIQRHFK